MYLLYCVFKNSKKHDKISFITNLLFFLAKFYIHNVSLIIKHCVLLLSYKSKQYHSSNRKTLTTDDICEYLSPAAGGKPAAPLKRKNVAWKTVKRQNSDKKVPVWVNSLPEGESVRSPIEYFRHFFDEQLLDSIVEQSNVYCRQQNPNHDLRLDRTSLEQFIGAAVYMSFFHLPQSRMYWSSACRVQQVADVLSRDRWEEIKQFIHFSDNTAPNDDRLFKIRLIVDSLLPKFQALPQHQMLCVHEQTVPIPDRSALKQPCKWAYKIFVLCNTKGLVHSFDIYTGNTDPAPDQPDIGAGGNIVLKLAQAIQYHVNHLLYFDERFSSLDLFVALEKRGIPALGTVQQAALPGCSFSTDSEMKKKGRGAFEEQQAEVENVDIRAVKWFDSRAVIVASTFAGAQPVSTKQRWDRKLKRNVFVEHPSIISLYKKFKGGVDALDALINHYPIHIRSKKYYHRLFFHFVDMVIVNSWLLYRRDCESLGLHSKKQMDLLAFRSSIAQALCMEGKNLMEKRRGWPSPDVELEFQRKKRRGPAKAIPAQEVRTDAVGHWPVVENGRQRCKFPQCKGQTVIKCGKCNIHLCLKRNSNCFLEFHI
uniref:PiggyBac transposable element-derived protein domain-containing protein n=1 Tax=Oryzias latipes TaxID=8090 RepID=A0A3P9LG76_ORYLA